MGIPSTKNLRAIGVCAAVAVGASLGVFAPAALAAPSNDTFAQRTDLGDELPLRRTESNVGATKEASGEPQIGSLANAGHSIWWEWESPATEWITVSTCESDFLTTVNVFEGTELGHLTAVIDERTNGDEGPSCWASGTTFTFHAVQGNGYVIGADGNSFYPPPPPPEEPHVPSGEGEIKLSIEATPPPPNDDFAAATRIGTSFEEVNESPFEEPNDDRYFWEEVIGYNWGATKQAGEPDHAGDPGGASVWYAWTPPESGEARISLQGAGGPKLLALYSGSTLAGLVPVASSAESPSSFSADVIGGTEYRIAVDGSQSENTLEPWRGSAMGSFGLAIQMKLPPLPGSPWEPTGGETATPPTTGTPTIWTPNPPESRPTVPARSLSVDLGAHGVDAVKRTATFRFHASVGGATFTCKVDDQASKACRSPFKVGGLHPGKHRLEVVAAAPERTASAPAIVHFALPAAQRHPHRAG